MAKQRLMISITAAILGFLKFMAFLRSHQLKEIQTRNLPKVMSVAIQDDSFLRDWVIEYSAPQKAYAIGVKFNLDMETVEKAFNNKEESNVELDKDALGISSETEFFERRNVSNEKLGEIAKLISVNDFKNYPGTFGVDQEEKPAHDRRIEIVTDKYTKVIYIHNIDYEKMDEKCKGTLRMWHEIHGIFHDIAPRDYEQELDYLKQ